MADKKVRLNLGSGSIYKPGYVNIDKFDSVADKVVDVCDLPYESNTVESIEASQLVEHFDYIHYKYILSEWFRVLKPSGTLILETPDLEKTFKKSKKTKSTDNNSYLHCSKAAITFSTFWSSKASPMICKPVGMQSTSPAGTVPAGTPARFTGTVKTS